MSDWQPIETAPKDGTIFLAYWHDSPVFVAWVNMPARKRRERVGWFKTVLVEGDPEAGWRVLLPNRVGGFSVHGNYAPFVPRVWTPIPLHPSEAP